MKPVESRIKTILTGKVQGIYEIIGEPRIDSRGYLVRTFDRESLKPLGIDRHWAQQSVSHTNKMHTLRGIHVLVPPHEETKIINIVRGKMNWIAVDLRKNSPTFGQWQSTLLNDEIHNSLYVEPGFAHGCVSLTDDCDLVIKTDQEFSEAYGCGIVWNDPQLGIDWGIGNELPILSERDRDYPSFQNYLDTFAGR